MGKKKVEEPKPKSITSQLEEIVESMCSSYCKWPIIWDAREGDLFESDVCTNCPLNRL